MPRKNKKVDARVERAYLASCQNIQIDIMQIPKIFALGRERIADGATDEELQSAIRTYVEKIRCN